MIKTLFILLAAFRVAFVGDPQVDNDKELAYARASIYKELRSRSDIDLVVILGDLVNDNPSLIAASKASLDSLPCPWICAPGNHDKDVYRGTKRPRDLQTFEEVLGYTDTTFVMGGVRFISFDNVRTTGRGGYEGGLSATQKEWLQRALEASGEPVVLCAHIPFTECAAKDSLDAIIAPHADRMLMMVGHTHIVSRGRYGALCEEVQAGATCGSWWRGVKDAEGIPYALMGCGAPRGYFVADFRPQKKNWYSLEYKCVGQPAEEQASATRLGDKVLVNVYGGSSDGVVQVRRGSKWITLPRIASIAPEVQEIILQNMEATREYRKAHKEEFIPMLRHPSSHVWLLPEAASGVLKCRYRDSSMSFRRTLEIKEGREFNNDR